jgi:hypothetical protein
MQDLLITICLFLDKEHTSLAIRGKAVKNKFLNSFYCIQNINSNKISGRDEI